jgi:alkyl hydroperoxide reductase subunit AhpC
MDIENTFKYHAPKDGQADRYVSIRDKAKELALLIAAETPVSREQSVALTHLQAVVMFANAAIAINE